MTHYEDLEAVRSSSSMKHRSPLRNAAFCLFLTLLVAAPGLRAADDMDFHPHLEVFDGDQPIRVSLTGQTARTFLLFRVYNMAHYAEPLAGKDAGLSPATVLKDGPVKAIVITFARRLGMERVRKELRISVQRNAQPGWLEQAGVTLKAFLAAIDRDIQPGDRLTYYWLPEGRLFVEFNGERFFTAQNVIFAKLIWSIWFGDAPACNREALLALSPPADPVL